MCAKNAARVFSSGLCLQEGAFALAFKSVHYPGEVVVTRSVIARAFCYVRMRVKLVPFLHRGT